MFDFDITMYMGMKSLNSTKNYAGVTSDALHTRVLGPGITYKKGSVPFGKLSYKFIEEYKNGKGHGLYYRYDQEDKYTEVGTLNEGKYVGPCFASKGNIKEGFLGYYDEYEKNHGIYVKFVNNGMSFIVFQYNHGKLLDRCLIFKDWRIYRGKCSSLTDYWAVDDDYVKTSFFPHIFLSRLSSSLDDLELSEPRDVDCFNYYEVYKGDNVVRMRDKKFGYISGWNDKRLWSVLKTEKSQSFGEYSWAYNKFYGLRGIRYADGSASIGYMDECNAYESLYMNIQTDGIFSLKSYVKNKVDGTAFIVYDSCLLIKHYENGTQTRNVIKVCKDTLDVQMFTVNNEFIEAIPYDKIKSEAQTNTKSKVEIKEQSKPITVTPTKTNVTTVKPNVKKEVIVQKPVELKYYDNPQLKEIMSAFDYTVYENGMVLNKVITPMRYCCIPHNVIKIGKRAFIYKDFTRHLETVEFMKDVRVVEEGAFYDCENLTTLKLNEGLEEIETSAFGGCKRLKRVIIPSTVKRIGASAFRGTSVKEVALPKECKLDKNAFNDDTLVVYGSLDELANYKKELERKTKEKEALEALALINARLKEIDRIEAEMDAIEEQERLAKEQEEKARIKKEQDKIKREQRKIEREKEKELALEKEKQEELALYKEMLENDPEEKDRQKAFGASYEFMFNELIRYKDSSTNVIVPSFITEIRKDAFKECNITSIQFRGNISEEALEAIKGIETLKKVIIPNNIKYIPKGLFKNCKELECVYISSSVKEIGEGTFENCSSLKCVHFGSEFERLSIGTKAFKKCVSLKDILLPKNTTIIGEEAFSGCKNLNSLLIPFETEKILSKAFKGCSSINKMVIPPKVYYFGEDVFYDCNYIEEFKLCGKRYLNKGLSLDGLNIHTKIYHLLSVSDISKLLTYKDYKKVSKMTNVDDELVLHQIEREDLYTKINREYNNYKIKKTVNIDKTKIEPTNIEVKSKRIEHNTYFEEDGIITEIKPGVEELVIPEGIKSVGVKGKHNIKKLTINCNIEKLYLLDLIGYSQELEELILGDYITDIDDLNKIKFPKLKKIKFGKNLKNIYYQTFKDFKSLEIIEFHKESSVKLYHNSFEGCTNLKQVINSHVIYNYIDYCFKDCKSLNEISFGKNLSFVGKGAFEGTSSLHTINIDVDLNKARFIDLETIFNGCDVVRINHTCTRLEVLNLFKEIPGWIKKIKTVKVDKI